MSGSSRRRIRRSGSDSDDQRTRFERDRDRILYTRAFRRLAGVTQVARANESYTYHDRLSHSLKVAQIGRRLAEFFNSDDGPNIPSGIEINPDVVETAALAHDIGHPPFGHAAETKLNEIIVDDYSEDDGFEGNAQSFRIVTRLCINGRAGDGLDLTLASLNAILKYPWKRGPDENQWGVNESKKWGVYKSDIDAFRDARRLSTVDKRQSAEAAIMDWSDDLAYAVHDMEDFYRAGIIPLDQLLMGDTQEREEFVQRWADETDGVSKGEGEHILDYISGMADQSLYSPFKGSEVENMALKNLSSKLIGRYLGVADRGVELQSHNDAKQLLQPATYLQNEVSLLKYMTIYYVIEDGSLAAQQRGQKKVIGDLFDIFYGTVLPDSRDEVENLRLVPNRVREHAESVKEHGGREERVRFAADVITSLTERQATQLHKRLIGDTPGSLQNRILR